MAIYLESTPAPKWFGKQSALDEQTQQSHSPMDQLLVRVHQSIDIIRSHGELDDELRYSLMSQALTYRDFVDHVREKNISVRDPQAVIGLSCIRQFCKLIEDELRTATTD